MVALVEELKEAEFIGFKILMAERNFTIASMVTKDSPLYRHWISKMLEYLKDKVPSMSCRSIYTTMEANV